MNPNSPNEILFDTPVDVAAVQAVVNTITDGDRNVHLLRYSLAPAGTHFEIVAHDPSVDTATIARAVRNRVMATLGTRAEGMA